MLRTVRIATWAVIAVLLAALAVMSLMRVGLNDRLFVAANQPGAKAQLASMYKLVDQNGRWLTEKDVFDRAIVVFFGFTHCPDVCPTTLTDLSTLVADLGAFGDRIQVVFITVDPERDTPAVLKDYMTAFDKRFLALSGPLDGIADVAKSFGVYFKKIVDGDRKQYTMDHTATVFLLDKNHQFSGTIDLHEDRKIGLLKLKRLAESRS